MKTRSVLILLAAGLLTVAFTSPTWAGQRRGGNGAGLQVRTEVGTRSQHQLRDGSCAQTGTAARQQIRTRVGTGGETGARQRLRDGSCLTAPTPAE